MEVRSSNLGLFARKQFNAVLFALNLAGFERASLFMQDTSEEKVFQRSEVFNWDGDYESIGLRAQMLIFQPP